MEAKRETEVLLKVSESEIEDTVKKFESCQRKHDADKENLESKVGLIIICFTYYEWSIIMICAVDNGNYGVEQINGKHFVQPENDNRSDICLGNWDVVDYRHR